MVIINFRIKLNKSIQVIVDKIHGKPADIIMTVIYALIGISSFYSLLYIYLMTKNPVGNSNNPSFVASFILISIFGFYFSQLGAYYKEPSKRIWQYIIIVVGISIYSFNYLSIIFNTLIIDVIGKITNIDIIPPDLLVGNIRVATTIVPAAIIIPIFFLSLDTLKTQKGKDLIRAYELDLLLPTVHKHDDTTIDIEVCKDYRTGLPCIVPEKIWYEHSWLQGATGSGKTTNFIIPFEEQLLRQKSYLTYNLKKISIECLSKGIATISKPITNKWFNDNFDIDYIQPVSGREEEFYEAFKKFTLGVIKKNELVIEETFNKTSEYLIDGLKTSDFKYECKLSIYRNNMIVDDIEFCIEKGKEAQIIENKSAIIETMIMVDTETNVEQSGVNEEVNKIKVGISVVESYTYKLNIFAKGSGRLVPKNLGMTVIAPDGELAALTKELGADYGVKVHKIDPFKDEIKKGTVAKFNPLKGDSPEKIGDIVASILVSMDIGASSKSNPYFTNASVRAVRNLVILLKISYPHIKNREPTLEDVLYCLNNFNEVNEPIRYVKRNYALLNQWRSVVDYFETSFLDPPLEHNDTKASTNFGSQKKETQRAIGGIINQLDNLLGREEIRYILCNEEDSLDLSQVLRKGECIAISTRQGNLGARLGKAFALFFILSLQNEVLSRYAENENPEIPHFLIIDEFPMYCNENTETFFSFARKYKCSVTIAIQNMAQLKKVSDEFGETIFTNTTTKLLLPKSNLEDRKYWSEFFGTTSQMELMTGIATSSVFADNPTYSEQVRGTMTDTMNVTEEQVDNIKFQELYYMYTNAKGRKTIGKGRTDFMEKKIRPYMKETFDFERYSISFEDYNKKLEKEKIEEVVKVEEKKIANLSNSSIGAFSEAKQVVVIEDKSDKPEVKSNNDTEDNNAEYVVSGDFIVEEKEDVKTNTQIERERISQRFAEEDLEANEIIFSLYED